MRVLFDPLDVLFFRDSRPFAAGDASAAHSGFPLPSVFYGALRTHLLARAGVDFEAYADAERRPTEVPGDLLDVVGTPAQPGTLRVRGPMLASKADGGFLYRAPLDLVEVDEELRTLQPLEAAPESWGAPLPGMRPLGLEGEHERRPGWLGEKAMAGYLAGEALRATDLVGDDAAEDEAGAGAPYAVEPRVGIRVAAGRGTVKEGFLYSAGFLRLGPGYVLGCDVDGLGSLDAPAGSLALGGERRMAEVRTSDAAPLPAPEIERGFRIVLATPAVFEHGWRPAWIGGDGTGELSGLRLRLVAAAVGKPVTFSGWDMAQRRPKPTRRAVPAGSVYHFELLDGDPARVADVFHWQSVSEREADAAAGFGVALVGRSDVV